jgi:CheY-like chemotaxis protein
MNSVIPTVLIVEDDDNDFLFLERALSIENFEAQIRRASDGVEAIDYLAGEGEFANRDAHAFPDLMVLDLKMPRRNGFEVLAWVRECAIFQNLPVVVFSSSQELQDVEKAFSLGACAYLVKPSSFLSYSQVVKTLRQILANGCESPNANHEARTYRKALR